MRLHGRLHQDQRQLPELTRRSLLFAASASVLLADERSEILDIIAPVAAALSENDAIAFMRRIPAGMADRDRLRGYIDALTRAFETTSSVDVIDVGDARAELDWYMQITSRATGTMIERRRGTVIATFERKRLKTLEPVSFFAPPDLRTRSK